MASNGVAPAPEKENPNYNQSSANAGSEIVVDDKAKSPAPVMQKIVATPTGLGLIAFATDIFLICVYGLQARGIQNPNTMVGMLVFMGGLCQFLAGIMEFVNKNAFGSTVFCSYAALNWAYGMIYLPGSGIMAAYTDPSGALTPEFNQSVSIFMWVWFIVSCIFTVAAIRTTWVIFVDMIMVDICLLLLACGFMVGTQSLLTAGYSFGLVVAFLSYWAGAAAMWADLTPIKLPLVSMV